MNLINNYTDYTPLLNAEVFFFFKGVTNIGKNIKTKEKVIEKKTKGSVGKAADRTKIISVKAKDGIVEAKDKIQEKTDMTDDRSPEQYATEEVTEGMQKSAGDVGVIADKVVRTVKDKVKQKKAIDKKKKPKQRKQTPPKTRGELSVKKPKSDQQVVKYAHTSENKIKQTARSSASTKNRVKTAENSAKTVHKAEITAQKSVEAAKKAKKAEEAAKKTAKATSKATKAVGKAIAEAAKATATAVKDLGAVIAAGGVPAVVVIIVICLLSAIGGTCFGIFLSNDDTTGSKMSMTQAISQLTTDYYTDLESFKNNYQYDSYEVESESGNITIDWKTVLAVYAVKTTTSVDEAYEVATMDNTKYELLKKVLYDMNPKSGQVTQKSIPIVTVTTDENGVSIKKTTYETRKVLTITIGHLSADEICNFYDFNSEQKAMLNELLSSDYDDLWNELINTSGSVILPSGTQVGSGGFVWPVAGDYTITSRFGTRVDPISGAVKTHGGTDIAAAHGTPIVAAADGTVIAATYNAGGYGYYVKIKHNDTYQTLYGHCSALIVSAGQTVKQGQVIAKVGSTGYSTGPHCHFEVIQNGVRVDAMAFYG
ncbi:MAG: M23 family metallopeptidase [Faecalibacterium sp.]|nr:M23 family metallopeptidase [Ruminococcus flavefaciens]MCM1484626.1 M23 family metallopeptidase [Faecalibacterium sp.]